MAKEERPVAPIRWTWTITFATLVFACLLGGIWVCEWRAGTVDRDLRQDLLDQARAIARTINPAHAQRLTFSAADMDRSEFQRLREQMRAYQTLVRCRGIYTLAQRGGELVFGPESYSHDDPQASAPGTVYREPSPGVQEIFTTGRAFTEGPTRDEYGTFVSALAPVFDPRSGEVLMVVGLDIEAADWQARIARSRFGAALGMAALAAIPLGGLLVIRRRARLPAERQGRLRHAEAYFVAAFGVAVTLLVTLMLRDSEIRTRRQSFRQVSEGRANLIVGAFRDLQDHVLGTLVHFHRAFPAADREEFRIFAAPFAQGRSIQALEWVPVVRGSQKAALERRARAEGLPGLGVWQKGADGKRETALGRSEYYPVTYVEPLEGNEASVGYDLGSEPVLRAALETARRTGLPTVTDPLVLVEGKRDEIGVLVLAPVRSAGDQTGQLHGFALAAVRPEPLLRSALFGDSAHDAPVAVEAHQVQPGRPSRLVAASPPHDHADYRAAFPAAPEGLPKNGDLSSVFPLFTFGKAYALAVRPTPAFLAANPLWADWVAAPLGILLTAVLSVFAAHISRRRADLEERVRARTADLQASEALLRAVLDNLPVGVAVNTVNPAIRFEYMNDNFPRFYRTTREALGSVDAFWEAVYEEPEFREQMKQRVLADCASGDPDRMQWDEVPVSRRAEATTYYISARNIPVPMKRLMVSMVWDLTPQKRLEAERLRLEAQLRQQQKLEAIGVLAGGVAHEINNPISGIMNYAQLIADTVPAAHPAAGHAQEIIQETNRVATIVRNLLRFARQEKQSHSPASIAEIIECTLSLVRAFLRRDQITLTVDVPPDLPPLRCRSQQLQQVLMNLLTNARDALNAKYPAYHPDKTVAVTVRPLAQDGRAWLRVSVADRGTGIPAEIQPRIFDPFFTTKPRDQGTGLALAVSHGIVKDHGGRLTFETAPGAGTAFHVELPVTAEEATADEAR